MSKIVPETVYFHSGSQDRWAYERIHSGIYQPGMVSKTGKKSENLEETHTNTGRTWSESPHRQ